MARHKICQAFSNGPFSTIHAVVSQSILTQPRSDLSVKRTFSPLKRIFSQPYARIDIVHNPCTKCIDIAQLDVSIPRRLKLCTTSVYEWTNNTKLPRSSLQRHSRLVVIIPSESLLAVCTVPLWAQPSTGIIEKSHPTSNVPTFQIQHATLN